MIILQTQFTFCVLVCCNSLIVVHANVIYNFSIVKLFLAGKNSKPDSVQAISGSKTQSKE